MSNPQPQPLPSSASNAEAEKVWLQRLATSPDTWRARATSAGGLLAAAAAASLVGLLTKTSSEYSLVIRSVISLTAVAYVAAVVCYLRASVYPAPSNWQGATTGNYVRTLEDYVRDEVKPIKRWVAWANGCAAGAVIGTGVAGVLLVAQPAAAYTSKTVLVQNANAFARLHLLCPQLKSPFLADVSKVRDGRMTLRLPPGTCAPYRTDLEVQATDVVTSAQAGE